MTERTHRSPQRWASDIAAHLAGTWAPSEGYWDGHARLAGPEAELLWLTTEDHRGELQQLNVEGRFDGLEHHAPSGSVSGHDILPVCGQLEPHWWPSTSPLMAR